MLRLERPLVFFDLEATGTDPEEARIIQIALQRFVPSPKGAELDRQLNQLVDPEVNIPDSVQDLTGIRPDDVRGKPRFKSLTEELSVLLGDADLAGYNALNYDVPLLEAEFLRVGSELPGPPDRVVLDPYRLEQALYPRTLSALYERYTGSTLENAHEALTDVTATGKILQKQLSKHKIDGTPAELAEFIRGDYLDDGRKLRQDGKQVVVCFGKHSGKTLQALQEDHPGYLEWMYETIEKLRPHIDRALSDSQ